MDVPRAVDTFDDCLFDISRPTGASHDVHITQFVPFKVGMAT